MRRRVRDGDHGQVVRALYDAGGNKTLAARVLGMSSRQLHYRLNKLNIDVFRTLHTKPLSGLERSFQAQKTAPGNTIPLFYQRQRINTIIRRP